tara:strand:+ start:27 stop:230 length:204 start_codon:yes stop_codon:yes gene_type:complete
MNRAIEYLKTLPENSGQKVELTTSFGVTKQFYFMWFYDEETIDLKPCDNINIMTIPKRLWHLIELVM